MDLFEGIEDNIPQKAMSIHNVLNNKGFETYFVGGALRDIAINKLLNKDYKIKDWDITTTARFSELEVLFNKLLRVNEKGKITTRKSKAELLIPNIETTGVSIDSTMFEVTPMCVFDGDDIVFTENIHADLSKRDFTINTIAYSPKLGAITKFENYNGEIIDPIEDIKNQIIRSVDEPNVSLCRNKANIMRGVMFAIRFGFTIEDNTFEAIRENVYMINDINKGKLSMLFEDIIMMKKTGNIDYLKTTGILQALNVSFDNEKADEFISILNKIDTEKDNLQYIDRLHFIYRRFSDKPLVLELFKEFGVNKDFFIKITE